MLTITNFTHRLCECGGQRFRSGPLSRSVPVDWDDSDRLWPRVRAFRLTCLPCSPAPIWLTSWLDQKLVRTWCVTPHRDVARCPCSRSVLLSNLRHDAVATTTTSNSEPSRRGVRRRGRSDPIDAHLAAVGAFRLDTARLPAPRTDGDREALRILLGARQEPTRTRTRRINWLRALLLTGDDTDRTLARSALTTRTLTTLAQRRNETREHAIRRGELRRLTRSIHAAATTPPTPPSPAPARSRPAADAQSATGPTVVATEHSTTHYTPSCTPDGGSARARSTTSPIAATKRQRPRNPPPTHHLTHIEASLREANTADSPPAGQGRTQRASRGDSGSCPSVCCRRSGLTSTSQAASPRCHAHGYVRRPGTASCDHGRRGS